ncbi:MAG: hypothetical protein R2695_02955 [Acidimicrobiales bacterium]
MWIVVGVLAALVVVGAGSYLAVWATLRRRNQVVRGVRSAAPLSWLHSGRREAKLHRRLRSSGRRLELVDASADVTDIVARLRIELVELDSYLVTVARRPSASRRADRPRLVERVEQIEQLVHRVEERSRADLVSLDDLHHRLELLEAADSELDELR